MAAKNGGEPRKAEASQGGGAEEAPPGEATRAKEGGIPREQSRRRSKREKGRRESQKGRHGDSGEKPALGGHEAHKNGGASAEGEAGPGEGSQAALAPGPRRLSHRHRGDSQHDPAHKAYWPLLNSVFGKVRARALGLWGWD
ncbi:calcium-binding protein 4-like [Monodelphis domestica]|uniref:calcium-binding protein 4-like n=1 Tax=Monodelphis domestica TaxID=13616 RepID=UPI0024E1B176|nr:calcium-binding protein 4-like [Monodelphis domestica]